VILFRVLFQTVFMALGQIWANKVRALLTTLGIIIGVASIVAVVAALAGLRDNVLSEFETFGVKKVYIDGRRPDSWRNRVSWLDVQLSLQEVQAIRERCPSVARINPFWRASSEVDGDGITIQGVPVTGILPDWHDIEDRTVIMGRELSRLDDDEKKPVCLINEKGIEELNLDDDPTGSWILIGGRRFLVVGVVETKDLSGMFGGGDVKTEIYIPFQTAQLLNPDGWISEAVAEMRDTDSADNVKAEVGHVLRTMRKIKPDEEDTFVVEVLQQYIDQFNRLAAAITAGAGGIVGISLLVGGIGIMNIMLVSVSERTREIGLRKALGARPSIVLSQFLVEAVVLCLAGAALGLLAGHALVVAMRAIPDSPLEGASIPPWAIILSAGFSAATGVIFGMFPALKAARLDPIEALRHE